MPIHFYSIPAQDLLFFFSSSYARRFLSQNCALCLVPICTSSTSTDSTAPRARMSTKRTTFAPRFPFHLLFHFTLRYNLLQVNRTKRRQNTHIFSHSSTLFYLYL